MVIRTSQNARVPSFHRKRLAGIAAVRMVIERSLDAMMYKIALRDYSNDWVQLKLRIFFVVLTPVWLCWSWSVWVSSCLVKFIFLFCLKNIWCPQEETDQIIQYKWNKSRWNKHIIRLVLKTTDRDIFGSYLIIK